jgi:hypothetical protein
MFQMLQNPWMALQDAQSPVMLQGVPYVENAPMPQNFDGSMDFSQPAAAPELGADYQRILKRIEQRTVQGIGDQRKSVDQLQKYKEALLAQGGAGLDLSPLMKLADTWTGSKLSGGYEAPESAGQRLNRAMGVEQQIANQQGKITDDEIALLRQQLYGEGLKTKAGQAAGGKELSAAAILKVNEGNAIPALLNQVSDTIEANQDYLGYNAALANTEVGRFMAPQNYEKSKTIDSQMRAASQAFGKYMEGGVLRKEDEEKYRKMFPSLSDTPQVARNKLAVVQNMLMQKQQSDVSALRAQGFNTRGLEVPGQMPELPGVLSGGAPSGKKPSFEEWRKAKGL